MKKPFWSLNVFVGIIALFVGIAQSPVLAQTDDRNVLKLCPLTSAFTAQPPLVPDARSDGIGYAEQLVISLAELNGYFTGTPVLTFQSGSVTLDKHRRACLRNFTKIYALSVRAGGYSVRDRDDLGLSVIGHADGTNQPAVNFPLSYRRAARVRTELKTSLGAALNWKWLPPIRVEGRGEEEPWWCGSNLAAACSFRVNGPGNAGIGAQADPQVTSIRNDRRVELRLESASILGPRSRAVLLDRKAILLSQGITTGQELNSEPLQRLLRFEQRMRYFPAGVQALHPVSLTLADMAWSADDRRCQVTPDNRPAIDTDPWLDSGWSQVSTGTGSMLEPADSKGDFDDASLWVRLRAVPVVTRATRQPGRVRIMLELATGLIGRIATDDTAKVAALLQPDTSGAPAADRTGEAGVIRYDLGLGVPDYWRVRLRLAKAVTDILGKPETGPALQACLTQAGLGREIAGTGAGIVSLALAALPKDFDGLLGQAYDFNRPTRMFGLFPGFDLRIDTGQLALPLPLKGPDGQSLAAIGASRLVRLYGAPLSLRTNPGGAAGGNESAANWQARSGMFGDRSVSLNPTLQSIWQDIDSTKDFNKPPMPEGVSRALPLGNAYVFERFLRGRVVRVFLPDPTEGGSGVVADYKIFEANAGPNARRDVVLVAADTPEQLEVFARDRFSKNNVLLEKDESDSACEVIDKKNGDKISGNNGVICGYFRQPLSLSLMLPAWIDSSAVSVPLGTRIGAMADSDTLLPCFRRRTGREFGPADRLHGDTGKNGSRGVVIVDLGARNASPRFYDGNDCRMLGLPILDQGKVNIK